MQHDAPAVKLKWPSGSQSAVVRDAYAECTRNGLEVMADQIVRMPSTAPNANGHLAWDVSFCVRAACLAWKQTGDAWFLRRAAEWAERICAGTDFNSGLVDWRGRSGPTWSAGSRYTAGIATVGAVSGEPIRVQAAADAVLVERPTPGTARVAAIRDGRVAWEPPEGSVFPDSERYLPDLLSRGSSVHALLFQGMKGPTDLSGMQSGCYDLSPQFASHLVHTGLIAGSLVFLARTLSRAPDGLVEVPIGVQDLMSTARQAIAAHADELIFNNGQPWYVTPLDFPGRRLGMELPHNHVAEIATSLMVIGRNDDDAELVTLGKALALRFISEIEAYDRGENQSPWTYYPLGSDSFKGVQRDVPAGERVVKPASRAEDSSHATMRVRALIDWRELDETLVPDRVLRAVSTTFYDLFLKRKGRAYTQRYMAGDASPEQKVGITDTYVGAWGGLASWNPLLRRTINGIASRNPPGAYFGATVLAAAEIVEMNSR